MIKKQIEQLSQRYAKDSTADESTYSDAVYYESDLADNTERMQDCLEWLCENHVVVEKSKVEEAVNALSGDNLREINRLQARRVLEKLFGESDESTNDPESNDDNLKNKLQKYYKLHEEIDDLCERIVNYYCSFPLLLDSMGGCCDYEKFSVDDDSLCITCTDLHYDCYDCTCFSIPLDELDDWKNYIQKMEDEKQEERCDRLERNEKQAKEERRKLYEELKNEFEAD